MAKTSLERAPFARAAAARPQNRALRLAALLVGTGLSLHAAPARAANECGTLPPGGGTVTCPPGEYPNGIDYVTASNLEILLQPGVVTRSGSEIQGGDVRLLGPTDTLLDADGTPGALDLRAAGESFTHLNVVRGKVVVNAARSLTFIANRVSSAGGLSSTAVSLGLTGSSVGSPGRVFARLNEIDVAGAFVGGIQVNAPGAGVTLELGNIVTRGQLSASLPSFVMLSPGVVVAAGNVSIDVATVTTQGQLSRGISVTASGEATIRSGTVTTSGSRSNGIDVTTNGNLAVTSGNAIISGDGSGAIRASSQTGNVSVVSQAAQVTGGQFVQFVPFNPVIRVDPFGIAAFAPNGNAIVTSGTLSIAQGTGISAGALDNATILAGTTSAGSGTAIAGSSQRGTVLIESDTVTAGGVGVRAISVFSLGSATVTVRNLTVTGQFAVGMLIETARGATVNIRGLASAAPASFSTIQGIGAAITVNILAGGTLQGRVHLTPSADRVNNSGIFEAVGNSDFRAGADLFDNAASGVVRSINGAATFAGLETFNNSGVIDLRDGATNDSLSLPGAYVGTGGGRLGLDVDFAAGTADRLITGAATGATQIDVQGTGGDFTSGILLVDASAGTSPTAFSLAPGGDTAYLRRDLRFDSANNDFLLVQGPGGAVFETARFGAMATQLWYESADAVAAQLDTQRDGRRGRGIALWLQGWTGERERGGAQSFGGDTFDVSFKQDFQGLQGGLDFQADSGVVGITGGAGRSDAAFVSGNPVDMKVSNVGLYGQVRAGPLFFNALAKRDWAEAEIDPGPGLAARFDADLFGVQLNAGLRFDLGALFAEPSVGLSWVSGDLDSFESGPATVTPGDSDSLRARAGLRLGARLPIGGGTLLPFGAVNLYEELDDGSATDFTLGETLRLFDEPAGTRAQAAAGISFVSAGFEAFVRGEMDFSGGDDAKAVRAGARLRF